MTTLQAQLERLYFPRNSIHQDLPDGEPSLITPDGQVRAMVLELTNPADWAVVSAVWQGVQADLGMPAPAIAVSGIDGYQLWFSLADAVPVAQARAFLESLRVRYLCTVELERVGMMPFFDCSMPQKGVHAPLVPALQKTGRWSAFVASDLAAIFAEEPWLEIPPSPEAQANVLARLESIKPATLQAHLDRISAASSLIDDQTRDKTLNKPTRGKSLNPKQFLLDVLDDPAAELRLRIEAAKALLPYFPD